MDGEFLEDPDQPTGERVRGPEPPAPQNEKEKRIQKGVRKMHFNPGHRSRVTMVRVLRLGGAA
eukprot:9255129-Alexandrium_andersonii.AAC.1